MNILITAFVAVVSFALGVTLGTKEKPDNHTNTREDFKSEEP